MHAASGVWLAVTHALLLCCRLHVTQPKEGGLFKTASACGVHAPSLRAANLELVAARGTRVFSEPGWVLLLPGEALRVVMVLLPGGPSQG